MQTGPNKILDKIKNRTEKFSNELKNNNIFENTDPNRLKNLSMLQRIQQMYHSPNSSTNNSIYNDKNLYTYRTDIYANPNNQYNENNRYKKKKKNKAKQKKIENLNKELEEKKEQYSDDSSINNSLVNGIKLEETKTENLKPIIYTSQSFFIDKKAINPNAEEISSISLYKNITNKYPMKMKGDFRKLIEKNPDILKQKNPRIQITNATCELEQFEERDNILNVNDINLLKLNPNLNIKNKKKNKDLTEVVNNCDKDIYDSQEPYDTQQQRWISMSIPLKNDVAKWEFLNAIKGKRLKNNVNKFEVIQQDILNYKKDTNNNTSKNYNNKSVRSVKLIEHKKGLSNKSHSLSKILEDSIENNNVQYNLREMNYSQYYRSPLNTYHKRDRDDINSPPPVKLVKKGENNNPKKRKGPHHSKIDSVENNSKSSYNDHDIEELSGESYD